MLANGEMKNYLEFKVVTTPFLSDVLSGLVWELNILGLVEKEELLIVYAAENSGVTVESFRKLLNALKAENLIEKYSVRAANLAGKNWNEEWEKKIEVIKVSDKVVVKPSFRTYRKTNNEIVIEIDPKMSFGTGEHETTRLVIKLLEKHLKKDDKILDVGSGTAILSICSVMLGAKKAVAVDNNEWCYLNGIENVERNGVKESVRVILGEVNDVEEKDFDISVANINKNVLKEIKSALISKTVEGGKIILSGILTSDSLEIIEYYTDGNLKKSDSLTEGEWTALVFEKN